MSQYYRRMRKKLGIEINREIIKGTHSFRRNAITDVVNATGGNIILASELFDVNNLIKFREKKNSANP